MDSHAAGSRYGSKSNEGFLGWWQRATSQATGLTRKVNGRNLMTIFMRMLQSFPAQLAPAQARPTPMYTIVVAHLIVMAESAILEEVPLTRSRLRSPTLTCHGG